MAVVGRTTGFVANRTDDSQQSITLRRIEYSGPLGQFELGGWRVGFVADVTGLGFDIGDLVNFGRLIGIFYLSIFIVNPDGLDFLLFADVCDNLVDVVSGIGHHGIVGTQLDGVG
jgi:hypothetical protein